MFQIKIRKKLRRSQYCTLSLYKFSEQNTLYFGLYKNDKISQKDEINFSVCTPKS
jgi:hypothetical protein